MNDNDNYRQALVKARALCSQSERCRFEIVAKLRQWELSEDEITEAITFLVKERYLDEARFARFYVNDKLKFNQWGKVKLSFMLRQKHIPEGIIRDALSQIDDALYEKTLHDLLASKVKSVKGASDYERKGKLAVFAQNHGFEGEMAFKMAGDLLRVDES